MIKNGDSTCAYYPRFYLQRPKKWLTEQLSVVNHDDFRHYTKKYLQQNSLSTYPLQYCENVIIDSNKAPHYYISAREYIRYEPTQPTFISINNDIPIKNHIFVLKYQLLSYGNLHAKAEKHSRYAGRKYTFGPVAQEIIHPLYGRTGRNSYIYIREYRERIALCLFGTLLASIIGFATG